ncbi:MAG: hypothetical protein IPL67_10770 [Ignavibacteria bacterium]|nr:hypothetical protein [Ignavibacteria bacterium]
MSKIEAATGIIFASLQCYPAQAQQYNSDSYLSKPLGMATVILTTGERNTMLMTTFSLLPRMEFTTAYLYNNDNDP